jgi:hypothetical protein
MTKTSANETDVERMNEARKWVAKQLRFEHFLGSLERRVAGQLDDVRSGRK